MNKNELKVIVLSSAGQIIEFYDFMIFVFFADIISAHYFTGSEYARYLYIFSVFALGYFVRPLGGVVFGHFGDRIGRKNTFFAAIFMISIATLLMGFVPGYQTLGIISPIIFIVLRILQGFSLGGELPGAATFVYESMPKGKKIFGTSFVLSGTNFGLLLASCLVAILYFFVDLHIISRSILWRIPFIVGGALGIIVGFLRFSLLETPVFKKLMSSEQVLRFPIIELFKIVPGSVLKGILIYFFLVYSTIVMVALPNPLSSYLKLYTPEQTSIVNSISIVVLIILIPVSGYFVDKFRLNIYVIFSLTCLLLSVSVFITLYLVGSQSIIALLMGYLVFVIIYCSGQSTELPILSNLFPPVVRYSGLGAVMNLGAIGLGLVPLFSVFLIKHSGSLYSLAALAVVCCFISAATAIWLYCYPIDRKRLAKLNTDIRSIYKIVKDLPVEQKTKDYIIHDIEHSASHINKEKKISLYDREESDPKEEIESAGNFIKEYTQKILNARDEKEKLILSKLMHLEYDAVVHNRPVTEARRKRIENEVDNYLKQNTK